MSLFHPHTKETAMSRKKDDENPSFIEGLIKNDEYTDGDRIAVEFMTKQTEYFDPEPEYVTEYYVLWRTAGTNLPRWDGPFDTDTLGTSFMPGAFVLSQVVEKES
jgi:hypothetical protein